MFREKSRPIARSDVTTTTRSGRCARHTVRRSHGGASVEPMPASTAPRPGSPGAPLWDPEAIPAATVVVLRDGGTGLEVLMLRRDKDLSFAGGMWVFPGGRIDAADHPDGPPDLEAAARVAAAREAMEEAGLALDPATLRRWSHWTPPPESPKRFSTAFFVAPLPDGAGDVVIDDGEIRDHRWLSPDAVLDLRDAGEVGLGPPTYITLSDLRAHADVAGAMSHAESLGAVEHFATRICLVGDQVVALYHGDVGYDSGDPDLPGARHRLTMGTCWEYRRDPDREDFGGS